MPTPVKNASYYESAIAKYFRENKESVLDETLTTLSIEVAPIWTPIRTVKDMRNWDLKSGTLDCGWVYIASRSHSNESWRAIISEKDMPYHTQSVTIKQIMVNIAIRELKFDDQIYSYSHYD